jgi:CHAT domain-containing protein
MRCACRFFLIGLALQLASPALAQPTPRADAPAQAAAEAQAGIQAGMLDLQRGAPADALARFEHALALSRQEADSKGEAAALLFAGLASEGLRTQEGNAKAVAYFTAAIPLFAAAQDRDDQATAASGLAVTLQAMGRTAEARDAYMGALALLDSPDRGRQRARALIGLAGVEQALGAVPDARAHAEQALPLLGAPEDAPMRANALMRLGMACDAQQDQTCAADAFLQAADAERGVGATQMESMARQGGALNLMRVAQSREAQGDASGAAAAYARAAEVWHNTNDGGSEAAARLAVGRLRQAAGDWDAADAAYAAALTAAGDGPMRATALVAVAGVAGWRGNHKRALDLAEQALPLLTAPDADSQRATVLLIAGNAAAGVHDNARAIGYFTEAEALGTVNPGVRAAALAAESEVATDQGDALRGAKLARKAMVLHQQLHNEAAANKDRSDLAGALAAMGKRGEALATYEESLEFARASHNAQQEAASLSSIARVHLGFGDIDPAVTEYKQAQDAARRSGDRDTEATATAALGMAYHAKGDDASALTQLTAAIAIRRELQDRRGEAIERNDLALVKSETGDPQAALDIYAQTSATFAALSDTYNEAATLNNMGSIYRGLGAREEARRYLEQAKAIDERSQDHESLAVVLNNLAVVAQSGDELDDALRYTNRALEIEEKLGDRLAQARLLSGKAMVRDSHGDHAVALDLLTQSLTLAKETRSPNNQALALHNRGTVRERMGDPAGALSDLQAALPLWHSIGSVQGEAAARFVIARIEAAQGRTQDALTDAQAAIALNESQRGSIASADLRASWLERATGAYALRTELLMRLDQQQPGHSYAEKALEATEAARGRSLLDLLTEAHARVLQHADHAQVERLTAIRRALSTKAAQKAKLGDDDQDGVQLDREIDDLLAEQARIEAAIRAADPAYAALTAPAPMTVGKLQALLDPDTILLDYALGVLDEHRGFLWVVSSASLRAYELPTRKAVLDAAKALRAAIDVPDDRKRFNAASAALGAMLLGPAGAEIDGKRLVIVADGALQSRVPFAALTLPAASADRGKLVVETHEIVSEPSTAALDALRRGTAGRPRPRGTVAVFADPVVSSDDERLKSVARNPDGAAGSVAQATSGGALKRLPATQNEAAAILALAAPGSALAHFGFDATREAAEDPALADYRIVHFAAHGLTDVHTPALSTLVFSLFGPDGAARDGYLRLGDVFGLSLPVDLVVLSACESSLGRNEGGEGLVGISRGFLYAGAATLVTTLWDVDDASTADLMTQFYGAMLGRQALPPAAALRAAQRGMVAGGRWSTPYRWAAFTVQGEWR